MSAFTNAIHMRLAIKNIHMKKLFTFFRPVAIGLIMLFSSGWAVGQTITVDFETVDDGYTPSGTEGTGSTDIFNRTNPNIGGNSSYIWAVEDINLSDPYITIGQINITGTSAFTFSADMLTPTTEQWDSTDELLITYSVDGGTYQNLLWVQSSVTGDATNTPAALDIMFDGEGDTDQKLPAISDDYSAGVGSIFETFSTSSINISGTTLDITLQFNNLTSGGEGIYLDDIVIELTSNSNPSITTITQTPAGNPLSTETVSVSSDITDSDGTISTATLNWGTDTGVLSNNINMTISSGDTYTTASDIPAQVAGTTIYYEIEAVDNESGTTTTSEYDYTTHDPTTVIINEVDADSEAEFIELYDGGTGNTLLDGLVLVLYNGGDDKSYTPVFDLDGETTDENGYFVIGESVVANVDLLIGGSLQDGADAVALFYGDAIDFPNDTPITTTNLIDAIVYDSNDPDIAALLVLLNASEPQVNEAESGNIEGHSNQRFPNGSGGARNTSSYVQTDPSPGATNDGVSIWEGTTTDWNLATNWVSDEAPSPYHNVTIPTGKTPIISASTSADCYGLTLEGTATLTIQSDATNSGSLIIGGTYTGAAAVTYQRYVTGGKWHLLSAPVGSQDIAALLTATADNMSLKNYNVAGDSWNAPLATGTMTAGAGYAAIKDTDGNISITGTQNGTLNVALTGTGNGWNLLGNPYTSAVGASSDAGATDYLLNATNLAELNPIYGALYIWNEDGAYTGSENYYKLINNAGDASSGNVDHLQAGQGFFVQAIASPGNFGFNINMQDDVSAATFYKSVTTSWPTIELNAETASSRATTILTYDSQMTKGLDVSYDAGLLNSCPDFALYSRLVEGYENVDFMLQALPKDYDNLIVDIGLDAEAGEIVTFSAKSINIPEEYAVVLEDRAMNTFTDLSDEAEYVVQLDNASEGTGRFFVRTSMKSDLAIGDIEERVFQIFPRVNDHQLVIRGEVKQNTSARIYSITGQLMAEAVLELSFENRIPFDGTAGIYLIRITSKKGATTQKFIWAN